MTSQPIFASEIPVCIFAKPPVPAEVKTRLIPALGARIAADLAGAMLLDAWRTAESCPGVRPVLATTRAGEFPMQVPPENIWLQGEGDLGERIERILIQGLLQAPAIVAIGADSPALTRAHLEAALQAMRTNDAVVGPSTDGGFYLLGLRRCPAGLFASLPWSAAGTRTALRKRLEAHAFTIAELEPLFDIDRPADLRVLEDYLARHPSAGPAIRAWYKTHGTRLVAARPCE